MKMKLRLQPISEKLGKCSICTNWWFSSLEVAKRYKRILHSKTILKKTIVKTNENEESDKVNLFVCNHKTNNKACNLFFPSYYQLLQHKKKIGL